MIETHKAEVPWCALARCSLGFVLVAAGSRGVRALFLGDTRTALLTEMERHFPERRRRPAGWRGIVTRAVQLVDGEADARALPLDVRGSPFQRRVWQALARVPPGRTVGYAQLAARLGLPGGARAVGAACAANVLAVAVPCHRAVGADGRLAGYRWGIDRKRRLLERERPLKCAASEPGCAAAPSPGIRQRRVPLRRPR